MLLTVPACWTYRPACLRPSSSSDKLAIRRRTRLSGFGKKPEINLCVHSDAPITESIQMARIFITGSTDGLGFLAARLLLSQGHHVVLHARNAERGQEALRKLPGAENVLTGDLSSIEETKALAGAANATGTFDAVVHNAAIYDQRSSGLSGKDLHRSMFIINTLAPYLLTCLIQRPGRLVFLSSGTHLSGNPDMGSVAETLSGMSRYPTYSDTKLHIVILCMAVARKWPEVYANAVDPGWVPTKMGGRYAPGNLEKGFQTQAWLAVSNDREARVSGRYFYHQKQKYYLPAAGDVTVQEAFLARCAQLTGVRFPAGKY